jgi:hypothetical protein
VWQRTVRTPDGAIESQSTYQFDTAGAVGAPVSETITGTYAAWQGQSNTVLAFERRYRYDSLGRPLGSTTSIDGDDYTTAVQYDALGRATNVQDASNRWSRTEFNARGMAVAICESSAGDSTATCPNSGDTYLRTLATDVWGKPIREVRGNNAETMAVVREHRVDNGRLALLCVGDAACNLLREEYAWDANGNLHTQLKDGRYLETFEYDHLNRLLQGTATQGGNSVTTYAAAYDPLGNPCRKYIDGQMQPLV